MSQFLLSNNAETQDAEGQLYDLAAVIVHHGSGWVFLELYFITTVIVGSFIMHDL